MLTPTVANQFGWLYAIGNTPATSLTQSVPHGQDASILSLGCGDVRNILFTLHTDKSLPKRKLDITCCDIDGKVLARNFILLTLLINKGSSVPSDALWDIYYHLKIDEATARSLHEHIKKLLPLLTSQDAWDKGEYGHTLKFCDTDTRNEVRFLCEKICTTPDKLDSQAFRARFKQRLDDTTTLRKQNFGDGPVATGMRSAAPLSVQSGEKLPLAYEQYWKDGTVTPNPAANLPNPMFASLTSEGSLLHYGSDPVHGYHLATAFAPLSETSSSKVEDKDEKFEAAKVARKQFSEWVSSFRETFQSKLVIRFGAADAFALCHTLQHASASGEASANWYRRQWDSKPLSLDKSVYSKEGQGPTTFDMIDTSNLSDHFGALNLLVSCGPLLRKEPWATVFTNSLIQSGTSQGKAFDKLLQGHAPTVSLLLGLTPVQYWTNAKCDSHVDELFLGLMSGAEKLSERQIHTSLFWRLDNCAEKGTRLHIDPSSLARVIFDIYLRMFENENIIKPNIEALTSRSAAYAHFHRGSFAAFLKSVKSRVQTDWSAMCKELLEKIAQDQTLALGSNQIQELGAQLHLAGVVTEPWILNEVRTGQDVGLLKKWKDIPSTVAVTVVVPRQAVSRLYDNTKNKLASPTFVGSLKSSSNAANQWHNLYGDVHIAFGRVKSSATETTGESKVEIEQDEAGWAGSSPLIASFVVPTAALQVEPETAQIGISVSPTGQNTVLYGPILGMGMDIFMTTTSNTTSVYASRFMPNHSSNRIVGGIAETSTETAHKEDGKLIVEVLPSESKFTTLTGHLDITSEAGKIYLKHKTPIAIRSQKSPFVLEIVFGADRLVCPLIFPAPVTEVGNKTRVARTSGYIEVVAPLAKPAETKLLEDYMFPTVLSTKGLPASLNTPHINLDALPVLDMEKQDQMRWLTTLTSLQFSERELTVRASAHSKTGMVDDARVNFKESLFTMFMMASGLQGGQTGLFAITHPERGGIHMLLFVSAVRLDCAAASVVLDAAVLPLTMDLVTSGEMEGFLLLLRTLECCTLNVNDAELELWKKNLPALAERCRTWSHRSDCEYKKDKRVPVSLEHGKQVLCLCGAGILPKNFISLPEWEESAVWNSTRIAISPTFAVPFVEQVADLQKLAQGQSMSGKERCRNCGRTETPDGGALKRCLRCQKVKYCSGECQKKDWKKHRMECREAEGA